jgi:elongation factor G
LRVLDGGVVVFDAVAGVEPQSETVWRRADRYNVPRICFINKMDRTGAGFWRTLEMIKDRLGARAAPVQLPIGQEQSFRGVIDLLEMQALFYTDVLGANPEIGEIPAELVADAQENRHKLIEMVAESNDDLMMKYLEGEELTVPEIIAGLRAATIANRLVPIICGTALKNKGIQPMLDGVVRYLPSPLDVPPISAIDVRTDEPTLRSADDSQPGGLHRTRFASRSPPRFAGTFSHKRRRLARNRIRGGLTRASPSSPLYQPCDWRTPTRCRTTPPPARSRHR